MILLQTFIVRVVHLVCMWSEVNEVVVYHVSIVIPLELKPFHSSIALFLFGGVIYSYVV